jgi:hypothetical protein
MHILTLSPQHTRAASEDTSTDASDTEASKAAHDDQGIVHELELLLMMLMRVVDDNVNTDTSAKEKKKASSSSSSSASTPKTWAKWTAVRCDGCKQKPLMGPRYCCNVCSDFDLCTSCANKEVELGMLSHAYGIEMSLCVAELCVFTLLCQASTRPVTSSLAFEIRAV